MINNFENSGIHPYILVVDDDPSVVDLISEILKPSGFEIETASSGTDALKKIEIKKPDLILLDISLPGIDGFEICRRIKTNPSTMFIPIIMITANGSNENMVKGFEAGVDQIISKPFEITQLNARIHGILRKKFIQDFITMQNKELMEEIERKNYNLQNIYLETVKALVLTINAKDHYTYRHSENVARYAVEMGKELGFNEKKLLDLKEAGELHDLGKIGISDTILNKVEKLTDEEWKEIKLHPIRSVKILEPLKCMEGIIDMVRQHHERYDGTGYPDGLSKDKISLEAKILSVADAYDAMTNKRPYKNAMTFDEAIEEIKKCRGKQFDPDIADIFINILKKHKENSSIN